jgi:hypothetical protein
MLGVTLCLPSHGRKEELKSHDPVVILAFFGDSPFFRPLAETWFAQPSGQSAMQYG